MDRSSAGALSVSLNLASVGLPLVESRLVVSLQRFEQFRRIALLQRQVTNTVGLATEDLGVAFVHARRADNARKAVGQQAGDWIAEALAFEHEKTVRQTAQVDAGALGKPDPIGIRHDIRRRRSEVVTP